MKVLGNTTLTKDTDIKYPFGANLQDETPTVNGTPVVREIYGDVLMNIYRVLELTNETPNGSEDNKNTQFQFVNALKKLANEINDVNHVLTLDGTVWNLPIDLDILPNKFVCFAQASDAYSNLVTYTFKGSGVDEISFTSNGFNSSDQLLIIIESGQATAISLSKLSEVSNTVYTPLGTPISFNDTNEMMYLNDGKLIKDLPSVFDLEGALRVFSSEGTLILHEVYFDNGQLVCFCSFDVVPGEKKIKVYDVNPNDYNDIIERLNIDSVAFEFQSYFDKNGSLYISNEFGTSTDDFKVSKFSRNGISNNFEFVSTVELDNSFELTTNSVVENSFIYTFVGGVLSKYNLLTGVKTVVMTLPIPSGKLFFFNGAFYYSTGEIANKWVLS